MNNSKNPASELRELVAQRLDRAWDRWAARHPHLADAIDRVQLTSQVVARLEDDSAYREAARQVERDAQTLRDVARLLDLIDAVVGRAIRGM